MKYTMEEGGTKAEKKLSVYKHGLLYESGNEKKFFPKAPVPLSTLQRNDKSTLKLWTQLSLFLPFYPA